MGIILSKRFIRKDIDLENNASWYKSLYENSRDGIVSVNLNYQVIGFNREALKMTGIPIKKARNQPIEILESLIIAEDREQARSMLAQSLEGVTLSHEITVLREDGRRLELNVTNVPVILEGQVAGCNIILKDITEEKKQAEKINYLAFHDELTGLPNRRMFNQAISKIIEESGLDQPEFAVMVLDIDQFKEINDSLGHLYGDLLLQEVSKRISQAVKGHDVMLARMGGDEFTLLYRYYENGDEITSLAKQIIDTIQLPYRLKDNDYFISASIGMAVFPADGQDAVELLKNADTAMYEVKKNGKNGYHYFSTKQADKDRNKILGYYFNKSVLGNDLDRVVFVPVRKVKKEG